ncbi:MAG: hypothetical protein K2J60_07855 [Acetatifactor sp.]|nr:hypothetical protein [Acetatifactor sp.]
MNDSGRISLHRKILDWAWYSEINTCRLFIHMLLRANWKEGKFRDITVPRGSFVSSVAKLAEETNLTIDEVRTAILHLISTNEITKQSTNKYTVFTVVNYSLYQDIPKQEYGQVTDRTQTIAKLFPTIEESNKGIKEINNYFCSEPENSAQSSSGILLLLNDKTSYNVPEEKITLWKETYPAVDIEQELRRMAAWLDCNPQRRKTRRGINRFINSWLAREQDRGGSKRQKEVSMASGANAYDTDRRREQLARAIAETGNGFVEGHDVPFK